MKCVSVEEKVRTVRSEEELKNTRKGVGKDWEKWWRGRSEKVRTKKSRGDNKSEKQAWVRNKGN